MIRKYWLTFLPFWLLTASSFMIVVLSEFDLISIPVKSFAQIVIMLYILVSIRPLGLLIKSQIGLYGSMLLGVFMPFLIIFIIVIFRLVLRSTLLS